MYRIQVASDSAGNLSSSSLLLEFIWSVSEIQQPIEKFSKVALVRNWTRDHLFTEFSPPKSCYPQWKHRCFLYIILDNASTHRCALMKKYIEEKNLHFAFISPYSPEMVPVERYFSLLKRVVAKKTTGLHINWRSDKSKTILQKSMLQISPMSVRNIWLIFMLELKKSINNLNDII